MTPIRRVGAWGGVLAAVLAGALGLHAWLSGGPTVPEPETTGEARESPAPGAGPTLAPPPGGEGPPEEVPIRGVRAGGERARGLATLRGQVLGDEGQPVVGAVVTTTGGARTTTDEAGRYEVREYAGLGMKLRVSAEGYGPLEIDADPAPGAGPLRLSRVRSVEGIVVDAGDGAAIPGVPLLLVGAASPGGGTGVVKGRSAEDGRFRLELPGPGRFVLAVGSAFQEGPAGPADDYLRRVVEGVVDGTQDLRVELSRGQGIDGRVVDESGAALSVPASVRAIARTPSGDLDHTSARGHAVSGGRIRLRGLRPGAYDLAVSLGDGGQADLASAVVVRGVPTGTADVLVVIPRGERLVVRVVDPRREPVPGSGLVRAQPAATPRVLGLLGILAERQDEGVWRFPPLERGVRYDLEARGFAGLGVGFVRGVLSGDRGVEIVLPRAGSLAGRVLDSQGNPVPEGVPVGAHADLVDPDTPGTRRFDQTDAEGEFRLEGLAEDYTFTLEAGGGLSGYLGEPAHGARPGTADLVLRVSSGVEVSGILVDEAGAPIAATSLQADDGARVAAMRPYAQVGVDGRFVLRGLKPGRVRLTARVGDAWIQVGEVEAPASDVRAVLRLP